MLTATFILLIFLFVTPRKVYAYLDPGSGSYLTQVILGVIFGGLFMIKAYWNKINGVFTKKDSKKSNGENLPPK